MANGQIHINTHKEVGNIFPYSHSNQITEDYYWFLLGEINRGTIKGAVCRIEYPKFGNYCEYYDLTHG